MSTAMVSTPATAGAGEIVEVKILISHPMETGFRTGPNGRLIPRNIIRELRCLYGGEEVFRATLFPAIAANPFFAFHLRADRSGEIELIWTDEAGVETREVAQIAVS